MSRKPATPAPNESDPADIWSPLDNLVRVLLPTYLESLGFARSAERLRVLALIADHAAADGLRVVRRAIADDLFADNVALARHAVELVAAGVDELEVIAARRAVHDARFHRAGTVASLVLDICGGWAGNVGLPPGSWPPPRQCAAIALREIRFCVDALGR